MAESPLLSFRAIEPIATQLRRRTNIPPGENEQAFLSRTAQRDSDRLYAILPQILPRFPMNEAMMLVDILNGSIFEVRFPQSVLLSVQDALADGYAEKWHVDGDAFLKKLSQLGKAELYAIADAIEQAWAGSTYYVENMQEKLIQIGLAFSVEEKEKTMELLLAELATTHGYSSVEEFVQALASGEIAVVLLADEPRSAAIAQLSQLAETTNDFAFSEAASDIASALQASVDRERAIEQQELASYREEGQAETDEMIFDTKTERKESEDDRDELS